MPIAVEEGTRRAILAACEAGEETEAAIAERYGVSRSTVTRLKRQWKTTGTLAPRPSRRGPLPAFGPREEAILRQILVETPDLRLPDLRQTLQDRCGKPVTRSALRRLLTRLGLHKRALRRPPPPDAAPAAVSPSSFRFTKAHRLLPPAPPHRRAYPSDLLDAEWALLEPLVGATFASETGQRLPMREVLNTLRYQVRTGCPWRYLPHDLVPWRLAQEALRRWATEGTAAQLTDTLRTQARRKAGRAEQPTAAIADSQSVKTAKKGGSAGTTEERRSRG